MLHVRESICRFSERILVIAGLLVSLGGRVNVEAVEALALQVIPVLVAYKDWQMAIGQFMRMVVRK